MKPYIWKALTEEQQRVLLARPALDDDAQLRNGVAEILARVQREGDAALYELTAKLDGVRLTSLEVSEAERDRAGDLLTEIQRDAIRAAASNIEKFHKPQLPESLVVDTARGVRCERVSRPIEQVGLYVPAGSAPLPSTALMLGIPARLAGCSTRVMCSPVQASGEVDPAVLYAARVAGVQRVFKLGGAQAIAAMAYGTATIPKVDKIFGPGNTWVTEAK
ncbi:MAG TPA: histidinol dehydrogenase, partial [Gammaproteobacteria bacterium]|nr:histidinol dehydrogenase [Gammaproteobacteria bacterium]